LEQCSRSRQEVAHITHCEVGGHGEVQQLAGRAFRILKACPRKRLQSVTGRTEEYSLVEIEEANVWRDVVERCARPDDCLLVFADCPRKAEGRFKIVVVVRDLAEIIPDNRPQVLWKVEVVIEGVALERPAQSVVERKSLEDLPGVLAIETNCV